MSTKKKTITMGVHVASVCLLALSVQSALAQQSLPVSAAEGGNLWFVELADKPVASGNTKASVTAAQNNFRKAAK